MMMTFKLPVWILYSEVFVVCLSMASKGSKGTEVLLKGLGASLPTEVFEAWTPAFENYRQQFIAIDNKYFATGSGNGKEKALDPQTWQENQYIATESLLNETVYTQTSDLQMFPILAGVLVLGYNIEGVPNLNLTKQQIVGIYNGTITWWNDSSITSANPSATLPNQPIRVIARTDESGSTEIFTSALCQFNQEWNSTYGKFSVGFDEDTDEHEIWQRGVIQLRGRTNRGVSGLILSYRYSIGYVSLADAIVAGVSYAYVLEDGNPIDVNHAVLKKVMDRTVPSLKHGLTANLVEFVDQGEYPIIGFTYFISDMNKTSNCDEAREMVRYVEWIIENEFPRKEIRDFRMAAITPRIGQVVTEKILEKMTCQGANLYQLVQDQKRKEWLSTQKWRLPVFIASPIIAAIIICMIVYIVWQQIRLRRAIMSDEWKIPADAIHIKWSRKWGFSGSSQAMSSISLAVSTMSNFSFSAARHVTSIGLWNEKTVALRELVVTRLNVQRREMKKTLLWMRDKIQHSNVLQFYGMTNIDGEYAIVSEHAPKGTLSDVVQNDKYRIDDNIKFSLALDIASGMAFLHKNDIMHGDLMSESCFIDHRWNVKISDWEHHRLYGSNHRKASTQIVPIYMEPDEDPNIVAKRSFWVAPEILRSTSKELTKKCDIYSFAIILIEIFSREDPYTELSEKMEPAQIEQEIKISGIRPDITVINPIRLRPIIITAWSEDPQERPGFNQLKKSLKSLKPSKKSVMDGMMEILESYVLHLEDKVSERTAELASANQSMQNLLHQILPPSVAEKLYMGETVSPETFDSVTIYFSDVVGFTSLSASSSPMEVVGMLNDLYTKFDAVIDKHDVYKVETIGDAYMVISGLPHRNGIRHAYHIATMALDLLHVSGCFVIRHKPGQKLQLRVGIHSGSVVAGVVGLKMPRYCLFGDTVNTASRMESTSVAMRAQVSEPTAGLLNSIGGFSLEERGTIEVKGKGQMKTYFLLSREGYSTKEGSPTTKT